MGDGSVTQYLGACPERSRRDGLNPVQELDGNNPPDVVANLLTGLNIDEYFTRTDSTGTATLLSDALGSTIALTNSAGGIQTNYTYEPFGKVSVSGTSNANPYQFTGRENDGTGLYFYRARYYSPMFQRFVSQDPLGFRGGDANLYAYVKNSVPNFTDPFGGQVYPGPQVQKLEQEIESLQPRPALPPPDSQGPSCTLKKPAPPPSAKNPLCSPAAGIGLAIGTSVGTHVVAEYAVETVVGVAAGPEVVVTALALDVAFGAPIDLAHSAACGDF